MLTFKLRSFLTASICFLALAESAISQVRLTVVDQYNSPLANAVIDYESSISAKPSTLEKPSTVEPIYIMDQVDKQFSPSVLIIPENGLVSFPNSDDIRHHVYSFSEAKTFELKLYAGKPKSPLHFNKRGLVVMGCNIHDSMVGYIYVTDSKNTVMSDDKGQVLLAPDLPLNTELQVWHPSSSIGLSNHTRLIIDQAILDKGEITLVITTNEPEPRDSFEELNVDEY
ncbi:MAG: plastocyanin [Oleispira sp.]|jgi:plastocyanin